MHTSRLSSGRTVTIPTLLTLTLVTADHRYMIHVEVHDNYR